MPTIATYTPDQVSTQVIQQPRASANAQFGNIGEGLTNIAQATLDMKKRVDTTSAEEALVQFERDKNNLFFNPDNGYFNTQGRDAYDNADAVNKALVDLKEKYGKSLNQQSLQMFNRVADKHITNAQVDVGRHASKGLDAWEVATIKAQVENTVENAALYWNDPDRLKVQNALGRQSVIDAAEREGVGAEATNERLQTYDSAFAKTLVTAAIESSAKEGRDAFEQNKDMLEGPDRISIEKSITAKEKAEKTRYDAEQAIINGERIGNAYDNRQAIVDEVNGINDPELRKKTMTEAMRVFNLNKKIETEARTDAYERAEDVIANGGTVETFKSQDPEGWSRLTLKQQRALESGKPVSTDWSAYSTLMTLPKDELAKIEPSNYFTMLAPAERKSLISAVKSANGTGSTQDKADHQVGRTRSAQVTSTLEQLYGKKSKWNDDKINKANSFYSLIDEEVAYRENVKDAPLSSEEFTKLLSDFTRKVTIERTAFGVDFLVPDAERGFTDIPPENVEPLSKFLRDNNIPVTIENLIKAQQQAGD